MSLDLLIVFDNRGGRVHPLHGSHGRQGSIEDKIKNAGLLRPEKLSDAGLMKDFIQGYIPRYQL